MFVGGGWRVAGEWLESGQPDSALSDPLWAGCHCHLISVVSPSVIEGHPSWLLMRSIPGASSLSRIGTAAVASAAGLSRVASVSIGPAARVESTLSLAALPQADPG